MPRKKRQTIEPAFVSPQSVIPEPVQHLKIEVAKIIMRYSGGDWSTEGLTRATLAARGELAGWKLCVIYAALGEIALLRDKLREGGY